MAQMPIETPDDLFAFAQVNRIPGGILMFTRDVGSLALGQHATFYNERQLRRLAGGDRVQATPLWGPVDAKRIERIAKSKPYAVVTL